MTDLYERLRRERRKEQERISRRYAIGGLALVVVLLAIFVLHRMNRDCGYDLFGWEEHRRCSLPETWSWLLADAGASWMFWTAVITGVVVLVARFLDEGA